MDHLPSHEQEKVRKRLRSPEAYEKLREKVKGPEDLEKELAQAEKLADANLEMQTNPEAKEKMRAQVEKDIAERGIEHVIEGAKDLPPALKAKIEKGRFTIAATPDQGLSVVPEGNVSDRLPIKPALSNQYIGGLTTGSDGQ